MNGHSVSDFSYSVNWEISNCFKVENVVPLLLCNKSMVLAYKGLYEIYWVFPSIKSDLKDLATF